MKEKIKKLKEKLEPKEGENGKRKTENLVVFAIVLIITVVAMNYILSGKKDKTNKTIQSEDKVLA